MPRPLWARGGQAQTLLGFFLPVTGETSTHRCRASRGTRSCSTVRIASWSSKRTPRPSASSSARSRGDRPPVPRADGILRLQLRAADRVGDAKRGGSGGRLQPPRPGRGAGLARGFYHSGSDLDLFASVAGARARHPGAPQLAVGFSLSANTLLLGAARRKEHPGLPDAILAVNPPARLSVAVRRMERGFNRVYDRRFVAGMREALRVRRDLGWAGEDLVIPRDSSVREADGS